MRYNEKKAAQTAAFFIFKNGGSIDVLKLMKLMYLAERESLAKYGETITGDNFYSMAHGPVLSKTLDHMSNFIDSEPGGWESWISDRENHLLALRNNDVKIQKLTQLSDADLGVLGEIYSEYGKFTGTQLRNITHKKCTEWEDPNCSSTPIPYSRVLKCLGYNSEVASEIDQRINEQCDIDKYFAKVG